MAVRIHPTAEVSDKAKIGDGTSIWHQAQVRENVVMGKNCNLGKGVYVDFDVVMGDNCKLQNGVNLYHGLRMGSNVFVGPAATFTNDFYPRAKVGDFKVYETIVEDGVSVGANSTIVCGIRLGKNCMIGAGSVVTKDVPAHALVYGNPARIRGWVCECGQKLVNKEKWTCPACGATPSVEGE